VFEFFSESQKEPSSQPVPVVQTDFTKPELKNQLKIVSWNLAGFNSAIKKGLLEYVKNENPDIICFQETKIDPKAVKDPLVDGYFQQFYIGNKKGYSGVGTLTKVKPIRWIEGMGIADHDEEGRLLTAEFENFYLVNTYIPNSGRGLKDLDYRMKWDADFTEFLKKLDKEKPVIWTGDLNVAHLEIDLTNPKQNRNKSAGFSDKERENFGKVLDSGFVDSFRHLYPKEEGAYTFWSYNRNARGQNIGWRLDYFVISKRLVEHLGDCYRRPHVLGSDHCPLAINIALKGLKTEGNPHQSNNNNNNNAHEGNGKEEAKEEKKA